MAVPGDRSGGDPPDVPLAAAAVERGVGVEDLLPGAAARDADAVVVPRDGGAVAGDQDPIAGVLPLAEKADDALLGVVHIGPGEAIGLAIPLVEGRLTTVGGVEVADPSP